MKSLYNGREIQEKEKSKKKKTTILVPLEPNKGCYLSGKM